MRTTLNIADDILEFAKSLASHEGKSIGEIVSELARRGMQLQDAVEPSNARGQAQANTQVLIDLGFHPFPRRKTIVTNAYVNTLRGASDI